MRTLPKIVKLKIIIAIIFGLLSIVMWLAFVRAGAEQSCFGTIITKNFKPLSKYAKSKSKSTPIYINITESNVFKIMIDGYNESASYDLNFESCTA